MKDALRLGIDLGGTKIEGVILRPREGREPEVLARARVPTLAVEGYRRVLEQTAALVAAVAREAGLAEPPPIGVGMPGGVSVRTGEARVKNCNATCLNGQPFRRDLVARLGRPVAFDNDANCFALAEAAFGAGRGEPVVFGVILGTGVGGGIALDGARTWGGLLGIAGEWGHVVLDPHGGPPCYCGRRGCVETYLSGPAIERAYAGATGRTLPLEALAREADARATLDATLDVFGRAMATVVDVLDPSAIVLGGGVSNLDALYTRGPEAIARWVFDDDFRTPVRRHQLGDSAGVLGAALLPRIPG
jgi:fructokinase